MAQTILIRSTVSAHAGLAERITYANPAWTNPAVASAFDLGRPSGAAALDAAITQQAAMIGYLNDFRLMFCLTIAVLPFLLLIRPPRRALHTEEVHAVME